MGLTPDQRCDYLLKAIATVKHVKKTAQPGALTIESRSQSKVLYYGRSQEEVTEMADAMFETAKLAVADVHADDAAAIYNTKLWVGALLFGQFNNAYSLSVTLKQVQQGALLFCEGYFGKYASKLNQGQSRAHFSSVNHHITVDASLYPLACYTICFTNLDTALDYKAKLGEEISIRAREVLETYL